MVSLKYSKSGLGFNIKQIQYGIKNRQLVWSVKDKLKGKVFSLYIADLYKNKTALLRL